MPTAIERIQKKHEEAIGELNRIADGVALEGTNHEWVLRPIRDAQEAFAELLAYHTKFKTAAKTAAEIAGDQ